MPQSTASLRRLAPKAPAPSLVRRHVAYRPAATTPDVDYDAQLLQDEQDWHSHSQGLRPISLATILELAAGWDQHVARLDGAVLNGLAHRDQNRTAIDWHYGQIAVLSAESDDFSALGRNDVCGDIEAEVSERYILIAALEAGEENLHG